MAWMTVDLEGDKAWFVPGETIAGSVRWNLDLPPDDLEVRLLWKTAGKGTVDEGVAESQPLTAAQEGSGSFRFTAPEGPYSFSGSLISIVWAVTVVAEPGGESESREITLSATGTEVRVSALHL